MRVSSQYCAFSVSTVLVHNRHDAKQIVSASQLSPRGLLLQCRTTTSTHAPRHRRPSRRLRYSRTRCSCTSPDGPLSRSRVRTRTAEGVHYTPAGPTRPVHHQRAMPRPRAHEPPSTTGRWTTNNAAGAHAVRVHRAGRARASARTPLSFCESLRRLSNVVEVLRCSEGRGPIAQVRVDHELDFWRARESA
jgi:hypothetical protein